MKDGKAGGHAPTAWIRWFEVGALFLGLIAFVYWRTVDTILSRFEHFYGADNPWFASLLEDRLRGYVGFLAVLFAASLVWVLCLRWAPAVRQKSARVLAGASRHPLPMAAVGGIGISLIAFYFSERQWRLFGYPCWDNYCTYAQLIADWLAGLAPESGRELLTFMRSDYHSNSPLAPFLVALVRLSTGLDVLVAYRLAVALATAGTILTVWRALAMFGVDRTSSACLIALVGTNPVVVRSAFFPQTDPFVSLYITVLWFLGVRRLVRPTRVVDLDCLLLVCTGVFVKLSFLPALALLPALRLAPIVVTPLADALAISTPLAAKRPTRRVGLLIARDIVLYVAVPLLLFAGYQAGFGLSHLYKVELSSMWTPDTFFPFKVMSFLHAGTFFLVLAALGWNRLRWMDYLLVAWLAFYLLCLWLSPASGWDRFYLPLVPPLCVVAGRGMSKMIERVGPAIAWVFVLLGGAVNYSIFLFGLYF